MFSFIFLVLQARRLLKAIEGLKHQNTGDNHLKDAFVDKSSIKFEPIYTKSFPRIADSPSCFEKTKNKSRKMKMNIHNTPHKSPPTIKLNIHDTTAAMIEKIRCSCMLLS